MTARARIGIIGLGALGAAAAWRLAERGVDVTGIEAFGIAHPLGSSHGQTRLFREANLEHPGLTPMAQASRTLFRELEALSGAELLTVTGAVIVGAPDSSVVAGTRAAARAHGLATEDLDAAALRERYPQFADVLDTDEAVIDPGAGVIRPEATITAALERARALGAELVLNTRVTAILPGPDGVRVEAGDAHWDFDRVIVATGAWLPRFTPWLDLTPIRTPLNWFSPRPGHEAEFGADALGAFVRQLDDESVIWGHGALPDTLVKAGPGDIWGPVTPVNPDTVDRGVSAAEWTRISGFVERCFPGLDPVPARVEPCMITISPDDQFVIGVSPESPRVIVAGGDSGHAFKHSLAIGEILARDALDEAQYLDLAFVRPERFVDRAPATR